MAKVAVLVPNQEMSTIAKSLTGEFPSISMMAIESIQTDQPSGGPASWNSRGAI